MKSIITAVAGAVVGAASLGGFAFASAAPAQAACAPSFTSIPCTIVTTVAQAPAQTAAALVVAPQQLADGLAVAPGQLLASQGCPEVDGKTPPCGLPAVPGQLVTGIGTLPLQAVAGAQQIVTAPQTIANSLANAPGQFVRAIMNGGTDPESQ